MSKTIDASTPTYPNTLAVVDDEDHARVTLGPKWFVSKQGTRLYIARKRGRKSKEYLHRLVVGAPTGTIVDHISGDTMDNRRCNLRICTRSQNGMNRGTARHNRHGYKGISIGPRGVGWVATIAVGGKKIYLGYFKRPEDAAAAYDAAAIEHHGVFARTNKSGASNAKSA